MKSHKRRNWILLSLFFLVGSVIDFSTQVFITGFRDGLPILFFLIGLFVMIKAINTPSVKEEKNARVCR